MIHPSTGRGHLVTTLHVRVDLRDRDSAIGPVAGHVVRNTAQ